MRPLPFTKEQLEAITAEYPTPAKRPAFSALENRMLAATIGNDMRPWQVALAGFFKEFKMED